MYNIGDLERKNNNIKKFEEQVKMEFNYTRKGKQKEKVQKEEETRETEN